MGRLDNIRAIYQIKKYLSFYSAVEAIELGSKRLCLQGCMDVFVKFC